MLSRLLSLLRKKNADISGHWLGHYGYGNAYSDIVRKKQVKFIANIHSKNTNEFEGTIEEDESGIPEVAQIKGFIKGNYLEFVKTYSMMYFIDEKGEQSKKKNSSPHFVMYSGNFDPLEKKILGTWKIHSVHKLINGKEIDQISSGSWEMKRAIPS